MRRIAFFCLWFVLSAVPISAQSIVPTSPFICNVDYSRFYFDPDSGYLEIYYGFYPDLLTYDFNENAFHAGVKMVTRLIEINKNEVLVNKQTSYTIAEKDTDGVWYHYPVTAQNGYAVPFGDFRLEVIAFDSLAPSRRDSINIRLKISPTPSALSISDIELCKKITPSDNPQDLFYKNGLDVLPNPSLVFGVKNYPILFHYVELYNLQPNKRIRIQGTLLDKVGNVLRTKSKDKLFKQRNVFDVDKFTVTAWPSGIYYLRYIVQDSLGNEMARTRKKFYLYNPHMDTKPKTRDSFAVALILNQLKPLSSEELDREFRTAQYVAIDQEIKMFAQLTSDQAKREFLAHFWATVSRGRGDWQAIDRNQYLARVKTADEKFSALSREGWQTSRGRVYILYGPPDQIERVPAESGGKPYRLWYYYKIEDGVQFVFLDRTGYGEYELVHSTKRGELQDENWQRFLR